MALTRIVDGRRVALTQKEEDAIRAEWQENAARARKRPLSRWSFMQILDEQGLISTIQARIDAMPAGNQRRRAQGKFKHQVSFQPDAPEMRALKTLMEAADPEFDFDALWAAGEALEYGG